MELKDVFGEIEADGAHLVHGRLLEWALTPPLWHAEAVGGVHTIRPADPMTNDKRFEITSIDALSRDMFDAFERAAVAEKPKRRKRSAPAKPGPEPDHGDGLLFPPISASLTETQTADPTETQTADPTETQTADPKDLSPKEGGMAEKPFPPDVYQKAMVAIEAACPNGVPVERWQRALADAGSFFALWGDTAERLGWTADDLFGLHPTAPLSRMDCMGSSGF